MLVKRRGLQACLEPGRVSSGTMPASHTALLMLLHPDLLLQRRGEQLETLPSPDLQIRRHRGVFGLCVPPCACADDVDEAPLGIESRPPLSCFPFDLGQGLSSSRQRWKPRPRCWTSGVHATLHCRLETLRRAQPRQKSTRIFPLECSRVQIQMFLSSAKGLMLLLGFCLAFLGNCCSSPLPDSIKGLM